MSEKTLVQQYRRFLLLVSAFIFAGSGLELVFIEHYEETLQLVPFGLTVIGVATVLTVLKTATSTTLKSLRYAMWLIVAGTLLGVYKHFEHNYEFALEISPNISTTQAIIEALYGGSPFLAPGVFFLGAILAYAATWKHPELNR